MQFDDRDSFVAFMCAGQPVRPANILEIVAINQGRSPLTMEEPTAPPVSAEELAALMDDGHAVIDTRPSAAFGSGHIPGAYNINLTSPEFEQRVGWVVPLEAPMLLVLDSDELAERALHKLAFLGLDSRVAGFLSGGMGAWIGAGKPHATLPQISVHELSHHLGNGLDMRALDVRELEEWDAGHIDGALNMDFKVLENQAGELGIDADDHVSVVCAQGVRSSTACSILLRKGFQHVHNVTGGMTAWAAAGLPMVEEDGRP